MKNSIRHDDQNFLDLLQRWLRGDFRRSDEANLGELTRDDDFRREAMEGFRLTADADHSEPLASLRQRLALRTGLHTSENLRPVWMANLMAAAAVLVLIFGAVWFFQNQNFGEPKTVADARQTIENQEIAAAAEPSSEAQNLPEGAPPAAAIPPFLREETAKKTATRRDPALPAVGKTSDEIVVASESKLEENAAAPAAGTAAAAPVEIATAEKESAADDSPQVLSAPPPVAAKPQADVFSKPKKSEAPSRAVPKPTVPAAQKSHDTDKKPDLDALRKKDEILSAAEPVGGWDTFNEYIRQNALLPMLARENNVSGSVILQFSPLPSGETGSIRVVKSLGFGCDDEAKRLVQLFTWLQGRDNTVKVEIRFVR